MIQDIESSEYKRKVYVLTRKTDKQPVEYKTYEDEEDAFDPGWSTSFLDNILRLLRIC